MAVININLNCDLQHAVKVQYLDGVLFSQDNQGNKINVYVFNNGTPVNISGTVSANIIRSDGGTVAATGGTIGGNVASITLPSAAYAVPGVISIVVKLTTSGVITTIAAIVANMYESSTATAVDPGTIIPSIETLIEEIEAAVASIPPDYSELSAEVAKIPKGIPQMDYKTPYSGWDQTSVALSEFYVPLTIKENDLYIATMSFSAAFTSACTLNVRIVNKAESTEYWNGNVSISASGMQNVHVEPGCYLSPGEYRLYVNSSAGTIAYPYSASRDYIDDGYISNKGTGYFYNNDGIIYKGEITYLTFGNIPFLEILREGIQSERLYLKNPSVLTSFAVIGNGWTIQGNKCICNYTASSGNGWVAFKVDLKSLKNNVFVFDADLTISAGSIFRTYVQGKNVSTGADVYVPLTSVSSSGHYTEEVDLNHYVVYNNLDLTKDVYYLLANQTAPCSGEANNCGIITKDTTLDTTISFIDNLNSMRNDINSNRSSVIALENKYLISPNGTKFIVCVTNDGTIVSIPTIPDKTLFIGNSLLLGNGTFGMCASASNKDYYYYVTQAILEKKPSATFDKLSGTGFEGCTSVADAETWMNNTLLSHLDEDINLVIVQLGDNVNTSAKLAAFTSTCTKLIQFIRENAPYARIAWAGEWYSSAEKQNIISAACGENNATFIDLVPVQGSINNSYLGAVIDYGTSDTRMYDFTSYTDDSTNHKVTVVFTVNGTQYTSVVPYTSISVSGQTIAITGNYGFVNTSGVASHPGDSGMLAIGNLMIERLGLN